MRSNHERNAAMERRLYDSVARVGGDLTMAEMIDASGMTRMQCVRIVGFCIRDGLIECEQRRGVKTYRAVVGE